MSNVMIEAKNIVVDFPLYGTRSLKNRFLTGLSGGKIRMAEGNNVVRAVDDISFEFKEGDRIGFYGHNGSGKTTLLRTLGKIYRPNYGTLSINGNITSLLNIAVGTESEANGIENIYLRAALMGYNKKQIEPYVQSIIDFADLGDFIYLPMRTYSSGMQIRLRFAISTALYSDIVLMDEWLSVGDENFIHKAKARLQDIVAKCKLLVIASHDKELLSTICNKIYHLERGKITNIEYISK